MLFLGRSEYIRSDNNPTTILDSLVAGHGGGSGNISFSLFGGFPVRVLIVLLV
jgi:hypothetical protein